MASFAFSEETSVITINDLNGAIFYSSGTKLGQEQHYLLDMGGSDINYANEERGGICHHVTRSGLYVKVTLVKECKTCFGNYIHICSYLY